MADNFNLRQFLTENKLTKNAKLLNENADISGYWVMYGGLNKGVPQFIKMFPSEEEAQQALQNAPTTYGQHVLRGNWGIQSAQDWLASGKKITPDSMGYPGRVPRKALSPEELRVIRQLDFEAEMEREGVENLEKGVLDEAKKPSFTIVFDITPEKGETKHIQNLLTKAGVKATVKKGEYDEVMVVTADDEAELKKAKRVLNKEVADEFEYGKNVNEATLSPREKYLTRLVENALGLEGYGDDNVNIQREKEGLPPAQGPKYSEGISEEEMVQEKPLPEYKSIEELMKNIDHGTNEAACKYKMTEMKRIAQALEEKVSSLEEGEGAQFVDTKKVKQMKKDIMTLRKQADKLEKEYEKKFGEKKAKKEEK